MPSPTQALFAFDGSHRIAAGSHADLIQRVSAHLAAKPEAQVLVFNADTGKQVDLDLRPTPFMALLAGAAKPGKGRPKLGVVAKEVTLLPRHWEWLAQQPGGASVTLRKLIERASKDPAAQQQARATAAYHFMHAVAGNLTGFEEASRLLFAGNMVELKAAVSAWPGDIGGQVLDLAGTGGQVEPI
jgi:hypothetical protein